MKNTKKLIDIYIIALLVILCAASVLRTVALFTSFNDKTMHFDGSVTFAISAIAVTVGVFLFLSGLFLISKKYRLAPNSSAYEFFIPSGILSVALVFMSFSMFVRAYERRGITTHGTAQIIKYIPIVLAVFALLSAVFFFLNIMLSRRISTAKAALGICTVVFFALYSAYLYFAKDLHPTNSPNKIIDQMAYFSAALFCLFETRIALGRDLWKGYISFSLISALLTGYSSIPALIYYFAKNASISDSVSETVLTFTLFLYILTKLLLTRKLPSDYQCKMASTIERMASARENELAERRNASLAREHKFDVENDVYKAPETESEEGHDDTAEGQISFELDPPKTN